MGLFHRTAVDDERLTRLYEQHRKEYMRIAAKVLGPAKVEDAIQDAFEAFLRVYERHRDMPDDELHYYMLCAVKNSSISIKKKDDKPLVSYEALDTGTFQMRSSDNVEELVINRELRRAAFERLPYKQQVCLIMQDVRDCDDKTTARVLGVKTASMCMTRKRARDRLLYEMERLCADPSAKPNGKPAAKVASRTGKEGEPDEQTQNDG